MPVIKELPETERPREKLEKYGVRSLSNTELLAILIGTGTKNVSAIGLAQRILASDSEGIALLADSTIEELSLISGMGRAKSCQIVSAVELGKRIAVTPRAKKIRIGYPDDIARLFMEEMRYLKHEVLKVLMLNVKNEIMISEEISSGGLNSTSMDPRVVFRPAIKKGASSIVLVHNHPSGNPEPSADDVEATGRMKNAGDILGVEILDHIIIGDGTYVSLKNKRKM